MGKIKTYLIIAGVGLAGVLVTAVLYGASWLLTNTDPTLLWVASVLLAFLLGVGAGAEIAWHARGRVLDATLTGIDLGLNKVVGAARQVATIQDRREPGQQSPPVDLNTLLPKVQVVHRNLLSTGEEEDVIDL